MNYIGHISIKCTVKYEIHFLFETCSRCSVYEYLQTIKGCKIHRGVNLKLINTSCYHFSAIKATENAYIYVIQNIYYVYNNDKKS